VTSRPHGHQCPAGCWSASRRWSQSFAHAFRPSTC